MWIAPAGTGLALVAMVALAMLADPAQVSASLHRGDHDPPRPPLPVLLALAQLHNIGRIGTDVIGQAVLCSQALRCRTEDNASSETDYREAVRMCAADVRNDWREHRQDRRQDQRNGHRGECGQRPSEGIPKQAS